MAFDPIEEDCMRLTIAAAQRDRVRPFEHPLVFERYIEAFRDDPAQLIQTDRDRSFHLTAKAAELIDYRIPFATTEREAIEQADCGEHYLAEAVELNPANWDAQRMLAAMRAETPSDYIAYLLQHRDEVETSCNSDAAGATSRTDADAYTREFFRELDRRPYLRWLAALSSQELIAGRYRKALDTALESLAIAPLDPAGTRHTAVLALAKLEATEQELDAFLARHAGAYRVVDLMRGTGANAEQTAASDASTHANAPWARDPWALIARMAIAYRELDYQRASTVLQTIIDTFPHAPQSLFYQAEFPDGLWGRVSVAPSSDDELVIALSESTPLLQEGVGAPDMASFATWVGEHELVQSRIDARELEAQAAAWRANAGGAA